MPAKYTYLYQQLSSRYLSCFCIHSWLCNSNTSLQSAGELVPSIQSLRSYTTALLQAHLRVKMARSWANLDSVSWFSMLQCMYKNYKTTANHCYVDLLLVPRLECLSALLATKLLSCKVIAVFQKTLRTITEKQKQLINKYLCMQFLSYCSNHSGPQCGHQKSMAHAFHGIKKKNHCSTCMSGCGLVDDSPVGGYHHKVDGALSTHYLMFALNIVFLSIISFHWFNKQEYSPWVAKQVDTVNRRCTQFYLCCNYM